MFTIGLTGGIGSGKSTAAHLFAQLGIDIIDTDAIAHELVLPGKAAYNELVAHFGNWILTSEGTLNRPALRAYTLQHSSERKWLEAHLHPLIWQSVLQKVQTAQSVYCIVVVPLLIETQATSHFNRILVVDVPESVQIERTQQRDHISKATAQQFLKIQASREQRLAQADDILDNSKSIAHLKEEVTKLDIKYRKLAQ